MARRTAIAIALSVVFTVGCSGDSVLPTAQVPRPGPNLLMMCDDTDPQCDLRDLTFSEHMELSAAVDNIDGSADETCADIKNAARNHLNNGTTRAYSYDDNTWGDHHSGADEAIHVWDGTFTAGAGREQTTMIHEAGHHIGLSHATIAFMEEMCHGTG